MMLTYSVGDFIQTNMWVTNTHDYYRGELIGFDVKTRSILIVNSSAWSFHDKIVVRIPKKGHYIQNDSFLRRQGKPVEEIHVPPLDMF